MCPTSAEYMREAAVQLGGAVDLSRHWKQKKSLEFQNFIQKINKFSRKYATRKITSTKLPVNDSKEQFESSRNDKTFSYAPCQGVFWMYSTLWSIEKGCITEYFEDSVVRIQPSLLSQSIQLWNSVFHWTLNDRETKWK